MVAALLAGKYRVPTRQPHAVARPRLAQRLGAVSRSALTVVSAPAGFGKTTVLTEWLATVPDAAVAWVSLDDQDNDPIRFWTYVIASIRSARNGVGAAARSLPATPPPSSTEAGIAALLNELDGVPEDVVLVLDDYHFIEAPEVHDGVRFVLAHHPPHLHLVLATRADPPLPLARMRARGQLLEVRAADLRFTAEESTAYLNGRMALRLGEGDVTALHQRTEGWIAALQLAALSLHDRADPSGFIAGFAGDDRYVVDYLVEEVLARQPADVREFLLCTSVLERLTGPLCDAVTGRGGGQASLVALERANLFLVPLDDRRQWYRYHHLFAEVLRAHLVEEHAGEMPDLHGRASRWFEANDDLSLAISHAVAGGEVERAADLMELAMPVVRRERREAELARWVHALPEEVVRSRPVLGVAFVGAFAQVSDFVAVRARLAEIERSLRPDGGPWPEQPPPGLIVLDMDAYRSLPAGVEMFRAALALADADLDGTVGHARAALSLAPPGDDLTRAAAGALAGLAAWTAGDLAGAAAAYTESVAGLARAGSTPDVLACTITIGDIRRTQGRLGTALRTYAEALDLAAGQPGEEPLRGTADMHVGTAGVLLERGDLAAAAEHLAESSRLGPHNGLPQNPYRWRVVMAGLREAEGDLDAALQLLAEADRVYVGDYSPNVQPVAAVRARLRLRRGELTDAAAWVRDRGLAARDDLSYLREYEHVTLARILLAGRHSERDRTALQEALGLLDRLLTAAEEGGRGASVIEILILQALAHRARGDGPAALGVLHRAVALARPEGYVRLFTSEGPPMATLLGAVSRGSAPDGYVRRLRAAAARTGQHRARPQTLVEPLSERELDVLRMLGTDLDGPDIARRLSVSVNTLRTHTKNIYAKLGVTSRRSAVRQARDLDLLRGPRPS